MSRHNLSWTPEMLRAYQERQAKLKQEAEPKKSKEGWQALGRLKTGEKNSTESDYAAHLESIKQSGLITWYKFEGMKFRLADNTFYTPDFMVMLASGELQAHEVKGRWTDDARVKIKVASDLYPIHFIAIKKIPKKRGGGWEVEEF